MTSLHGQALSAVEALRAVRDDLVALTARVDKAIEAASVVAQFAVEKPFSLDAEARLRVFKERGEAVIRIASERGVPLSLLLGPGHPANAHVAATRKAAALALRAADTNFADIARILCVSPETARQLTRSTNVKKAA